MLQVIPKFGVFVAIILVDNLYGSQCAKTFAMVDTGNLVKRFALFVLFCFGVVCLDSQWMCVWAEERANKKEKE